MAAVGVLVVLASPRALALLLLHSVLPGLPQDPPNDPPQRAARPPFALPPPGDSLPPPGIGHLRPRHSLLPLQPRSVVVARVCGPPVPAVPLSFPPSRPRSRRSPCASRSPRSGLAIPCPWRWRAPRSRPRCQCHTWISFFSFSLGQASSSPILDLAILLRCLE